MNMLLFLLGCCCSLSTSVVCRAAPLKGHDALAIGVESIVKVVGVVADTHQIYPSRLTAGQLFLGQLIEVRILARVR